jgi:hypothetical protein
VLGLNTTVVQMAAQVRKILDQLMYSDTSQGHTSMTVLEFVTDI